MRIAIDRGQSNYFDVNNNLIEKATQEGGVEITVEKQSSWLSGRTVYKVRSTQSEWKIVNTFRSIKSGLKTAFHALTGGLFRGSPTSARINIAQVTPGPVSPREAVLTAIAQSLVTDGVTQNLFLAERSEKGESLAESLALASIRMATDLRITTDPKVLGATLSNRNVTLKVSQHVLASDPEAVLDTLAHKAFSRGDSPLGLYVQVYDNNGNTEEAEDAGGVSRGFISDLFEELVPGSEGRPWGLHFNALPNGRYAPMTEHDGALSGKAKTRFSAIGHTMGLIAGAASVNKRGQWVGNSFIYRQDMPIGLVFNEGLFAAMLAFTDEETAMEFENIPLQRRAELYSTLHANDGDQQTFDKFRNFASMDEATFRDLTDREVIDAVYYAWPNLDFPEGLDEDNPESIRAHFTEVSQALNDQLQDRYGLKMLQELAPIHAMAEGFKAHIASLREAGLTINAVEQNNSAALSKLIQGIPVTTESFLAKLRFSGVSQESREWFTNWIHAADDEKLRQIVYAITGSYSLGKEPIKAVRGVDERFAHCHTCFNRIDLPRGHTTEESFFDAMDESLTNAIAADGRYAAY